MWLSLLVPVAFASQAEWLCTSESSQIVNDQIYACGVGHGAEEDIARLNAFDGAKVEFNRICESSTDCKEHKVKVEPRRTTCDQTAGKWKCYRLVVFTVMEDKLPKVEPQPTYSPPAPRRQAKVRKPVKATGPDGNYTSSDFWRDWEDKYLRPID